MTSAALRMLRSAGTLDGATAGFLAALLVFTITVFAMRPLGVMPVNAFGPDLTHSLLAMKLVGEGWRLHTDIATPLGKLAFLPSVWGNVFAETPAGALVAARLLHGAAIVLLVPLVCWRRLSAFPAALIGAAMVATALTPTNLGEDPWLLAFAMEYNKVGFALTGLGFCLLVPMAHGRHRSLVDIGLAALLITLCFHMKITFAVVLAGGLVVGLAASGRFAVALAAALVFGVNVVLSGDYLRNIVEAGFRDYETISGPGSILYAALSNIEVFALVLGAMAMCAVWFGRKSGAPAFLALIVLAGGFALLTQNSQRLLIPSAAAALIVLFEASRRMAAGRPDQAGIVATMALLSALYPSAILGHWMLGIWHYNGAQRGGYDAAAFESGPFAGVSVRFVAEADLPPRRRDCRDPGSIENYLLQMGEIDAILRSRADLGLLSGTTALIHVDHVDLAVLLGNSPWSPGARLWRVSASAVEPPSDDTRLVLIPAFSKLGAQYQRDHAAVIERLGFRRGEVGCMDYLARG